MALRVPIDRLEMYDSGRDTSDDSVGTGGEGMRLGAGTGLGCVAAGRGAGCGGRGAAYVGLGW
jgi:hypothetical protein